jgi:hypothetical protein
VGKITFKEYCALNEKTVFDYLLFPPEGKELEIATDISKMKNSSKYVYRGMSNAEYKNLIKNKRVVSKGVGNTRDIQGSYVSGDIQLAGRFAIRAWKDYKKAVLVTLNKSKLPSLNKADPGNYWVEYIPLDAVVDTYFLGNK